MNEPIRHLPHTVLGDPLGMTREERALKVALGVHEHREKYALQRVPPRPVNMPDDLEIIDIVENSARGESLDKDKQRRASTFGSWRAALIKRELDNAMNAAMLCTAYRTLDGLGRREEADAVVEVLVGFGGIEWGQSPLEFTALLQWAQQQLTDTLTMSWRLRMAGTR